MKLPKRLQNLPAIPKGRHYLLMIFGYWAKGETVEKAVKNLKDAGGRNLSLVPWCNLTMIVYHVQPDAYVDGMGSICWGGDEDYEKTRSIKIAELKGNTRTLFVAA